MGLNYAILEMGLLKPNKRILTFKEIVDLFGSFVQQIQQFWFAEINRREKVKIGDSVSFLQVSTTIRRNLEKPEDSRTRVLLR